MAKYQLFNNMNSPQPLSASPTLYTHLFELGFSSVCELLGKRVFIRLLSVTGDSSLRSE